MTKLLQCISLAIVCLALTLPAQAQMPDSPRDARVTQLPPPRLVSQVPDMGPMQTREMSVVARVNGLHAVVETTMVFHNPNPRVLEGDLIFPLPDGAAVSGYALDINGVLVDGVVVSKERARVAFETETRRQVDPGLVEHVQGNIYRTRIYPLPAKGERRIRLTYTTPLIIAPNGAASLLLPMPRESIAKLNVMIEVAALDGVTPKVDGLGDARFKQAERIWRVQSSSEDTIPGEDILVALPELTASFHRIENDAAGTSRFMISTIAQVSKPSSADLSLIHVLWDASGSRAEVDLSKEFDLLEQTKASGYRLTVFRDVPEKATDFATMEELITAIKAEPFDGGTDFTALATGIGDEPDPGTRTLLFTDGFDTLSGRPLGFHGVIPVAVVSQTVANREALRQACAGDLIDLQTMDPEAAWAKIKTPSGRVAGLQGTGVAKVQGVGQPAHGRISLLGELTGSEATVRIVYSDGTTSDTFVLRKSEGTNSRVLATAWAAARVNQLAPNAEEFEDELLDLGQVYGLVSPATSLIVLETLEQWVQHDIEPPATLPVMRSQWRDAKKNRRDRDGDDPAHHLEYVVTLWKQQVEWWNTDFSKGKTFPSSLDSAQTTPEPRSGDSLPPEPDSDIFSMPEFIVEGVNQGYLTTKSNSGTRLNQAIRELPIPVDIVTRDFLEDTDALIVAKALRFTSGVEPEPETIIEAETRSSIEIKPWSPDRPYLEAIRKAKEGGRYDAYLTERQDWAQSPGFFLDCAALFYQEGDKVLGRRILTNLAELRIEDSALLRVLAWRLRQAEDFDLAIVILRRVAKLRGEEPQSFRDLALVLAERGRVTGSKADLEEAMQLFLKVALGTWNRHGDSLALFALEELNALIAWVERQQWEAGDKPGIPDLDERLRTNLNSDVRIVMSWDADATDIDLHVLEPGGEEASYAHNRTARGGMVSRDITDGYGPEKYMIRIAPSGDYTILAKYFNSRQQTKVGPATVTATVFTNWGRANEEHQTITMLLDKPADKVIVGKIAFSRGDFKTDVTNLRLGLTRDQVIAVLGEPADTKANPLQYLDGARTVRVFFDDDKMIRITETLPGGRETVLLQ